MGTDLWEGIERLIEIQGEMLELLGEAADLLRGITGDDRMIFERADAYWLAHIRMALTKDHGFLGGSMVDMDDTIEELEKAAEGPDEDGDEDCGEICRGGKGP